MCDRGSGCDKTKGLGHDLGSGLKVRVQPCGGLRPQPDGATEMVRVDIQVVTSVFSTWFTSLMLLIFHMVDPSSAGLQPHPVRWASKLLEHVCDLKPPLGGDGR